MTLGVFGVVGALALGGPWAVAAEPVVICRPTFTISALAYIAEEQKFFTEEGLAVSFIEATHGKICQDVLIAGRADFAFVFDGPFGYLGFQDHPLRVLAEVGRDSSVALVARRDRGITTVSDLKGKRIGYTPGTAGQFFLDEVLEQQGLTSRDVTRVTLQLPSLPPALVGGQVDAAVLIEPRGDQAMRALGANGLRLRPPEIAAHPFLVITSDEVLKAHPERARQVLRALLRAETYAQNHVEDVQTLVAKKVSVDLPLIQRDWPPLDHAVRLDLALLGFLNRNAQWIVSEDPSFTNRSLPNYRTFFAPEALRDVAPERVGLGL